MFANHFDNFEMEDHCPVLLQDHGCFINLYNHQMVKKGNHILSTCSNLPADLEPTAIVSGPAVEQAMQHCVDEIQHRCLYDQRWKWAPHEFQPEALGRQNHPVFQAVQHQSHSRTIQTSCWRYLRLGIPPTKQIALLGLHNHSDGEMYKGASGISSVQNSGSSVLETTSKLSSGQ